MKLHTGVLAGAQARALEALAPLASTRGFYLGGGTALALQFGHRYSIDFDWFTSEALGDPLRLAAQLRDAGLPFETESYEAGTLYGTAFGVRASFIEYRYPLLQPAVEAAEQGFRLASPADLACMKLSAAQRGSRKDFVDIYLLATEFQPLPELLRLYQARFQVADLAHVLYGLTYFDDADRERMPRMIRALEWRTVKSSNQPLGQ